MKTPPLISIRVTDVYPHFDCGVYDQPERCKKIFDSLVLAFPLVMFEMLETTEFFPMDTVMPDTAIMEKLNQLTKEF